MLQALIWKMSLLQYYSSNWSRFFFIIIDGLLFFFLNKVCVMVSLFLNFNDITEINFVKRRVYLSTTNFMGFFGIFVWFSTFSKKLQIAEKNHLYSIINQFISLHRSLRTLRHLASYLISNCDGITAIYILSSRVGI